MTLLKSKNKIVDITADDDTVIKNDAKEPIENHDLYGDIKEEPIENNDYNLLNVKPVRKERDTVIKNDAETVDEQTVLNELKKQ